MSNFVFDDVTIKQLMVTQINCGKKEVTETMKMNNWSAEKRQEARKLIEKMKFKRV